MQVQVPVKAGSSLSLEASQEAQFEAVPPVQVKQLLWHIAQSSVVAAVE